MIPKNGRTSRNRHVPDKARFDPELASDDWVHDFKDFHQPNRVLSRSLGTLIVGVFSAFWFLITLPFRLVFGAISLLGRLVGIGIGFTLMVIGMALLAGPFFVVGFPLFLVGLFLTLRSLG